MRVDENFIMRIQRSMFTIIMIFLIVFGIGSIISSGMLKAGDNDLAEALAKSELEANSVVMNNNTQTKTINKKEVKTKTTDKNKQTTTAPQQTSGSEQGGQSGGSSERLSVSEIQPPAAVSQAQVQPQTQQQTSFVLAVGTAPTATWSAIKISATKPTVPPSTAKVTKPTEATKPTARPTTVPATEEEESSVEPDTMPTDIIVTIPTDSDVSEATDTTYEPPTETVEPPTQAHTETTGEPETEQTTDSTGTKATTVDPLTSSEPPTAYPDATSATGPPLTTMPQHIDHAGDNDFGAYSGGHITNTADLNHRANNDMSSTLLIISVVFALVAIMLLGVYFHITKDKKKKQKKNG